MSNLVVTSTAITVKVVYNDLAGDYSESIFKRTNISQVDLDNGSTFVRVVMANAETFDISFNTAAGAMIVDTVDGVAPTSNTDLRDKILALVL